MKKRKSEKAEIFLSVNSDPIKYRHTEYRLPDDKTGQYIK